MLWFVPTLHGCLVCLLLCKEEGSSPVSAITERRDMGLYEVPCCCLPMTLASGGTPMFPLVVHQPASLASSAVTRSVHKSRSDNAAGVRTFFIYHSDHYGLSFSTLRMPYYFYKVSHFMCVMYLTAILRILLMTDGLNTV